MFGAIQQFLSGILPKSKSKVDLRIAEATQGWIAHKELEWLATQALTHERIVEVGSYLGRSTRALGDNTKGVVYAVDNFKGPQDIGVCQPIAQNVFEIFLYNNGTLINAGTVIPVVADHAQIPALPITPDMVFIDGDHSYEAVKRDIEYWLTRLPSGALLCGHDAQFKEVRKAVDETLTDYKVAKDTTIWYTTV